MDMLCDKQDWYRIPEREVERTKVTLKVGDKIRVKNRLIFRCGYYFEPKDMPESFAKKMARDKLIEFFGKIVKNPEIAESYYADFIRFVDLGYNGEEKILKHLMYKERGKWLGYQHKEDIPKNLRTFWYKDVKLHQDQEFIIHAICPKWIGWHYPPHEDYGGEYWPGELENTIYQQIYEIGKFVPLVGFSLLSNIFVHPLDAELIKE